MLRSINNNIAIPLYNSSKSIPSLATNCTQINIIAKRRKSTKLQDSEIIGVKHNRLTIIKYSHSNKGKRYFECLCECGNITTLPLSVVRSGSTKSCGCAKSQHGLSQSRIYGIYKGMVRRCHNPTSKLFIKYGAKGITVDDTWRNDFMSFYTWSMNNGYNNTLTIDRIDNNKGYSPSNCRWETYTIQNINKNILKTNTSGFTGVSWSISENKWIAMISISNKAKRIGSYKKLCEAIMARNKYIDDNNLPHMHAGNIDDCMDDNGVYKTCADTQCRFIPSKKHHNFLQK